MDPVSLTFLDSLDVPFIKIGSGDADNLMLIRKAAETRRPLIVSTGMQDLSTVQQIYDNVTQVHNQLVLMHCVSTYPTPEADVNLRVLQEYQRLFPDVPVGYSGHELGTVISVAAVALGAKVIERHITLNKRWKGTDHACSLEPQEFSQLVRDVRSVERALGSGVKRFQASEQSCHDKLGKSVVAATDLPRGTTLTEHNVKIKVSEPQGVSCKHLPTLLGQALVSSVLKDCPITLADLGKT